MDKILIKYSDFFDDDGGFRKAIDDFRAVGKELIDEAEKIKKGISFVDTDNVKAVRQFEEQAQDLIKTQKEYTETLKEIDAAEEDLQKTELKGLKISAAQQKAIDQLNTTLAQQKVALQIINKAEKAGEISTQKAAEARGRLKLETKATTIELRKYEKEVIDQNKLSVRQQKLIKAEQTLRRGQATTIQEIRERLAALRLVASEVNITTPEGVQQVKDFNEEINALTDQLAENSDKFIQNKINVGNYEESINKALGNTKLFATGIGGLDDAIQGLVGALTLSQEEAEKLREATDGNVGAIKRFGAQFARLNKTLKASIIGVVVLAIAALGSVFGSTRAGAANLEKVLQSIGNTITVIGTAARVAFTGIGNLISQQFNTIKAVVAEFDGLNFFDAFTKLTSGDANIFGKFSANAVKSFDIVKDTFKETGAALRSGGEAIVEGLENIDRAFRLEDTVRQLNRELAILQGQIDIINLKSTDATRSLNEQLRSTEQLLNLSEDAAAKRLQIAELELQAINERVIQNVKANKDELASLDITQKGVAFATQVQNLALARGSALKINNDLIEEQQQAILKVTEAENAQNTLVEENGRQRREIQRDLFEQNLDLLIDFIDTEKNLNEQQVLDTTSVFADRVIAFENFVKKFRENAQKELDEFSKFAQKTGKDIDFQIEFADDNSFKVFQNGVELSLKDIVELNKELQALGLAEIPINRFREFNVEAVNAQRDFNNLNKEIKATGRLVRELNENLIVDQAELDALDALNEKITAIGEVDVTGLDPAARAKVLKDLEELEKARTAVIKRADEQRKGNRLIAIDEELQELAIKNEEAFARTGQLSDREIELEREKAALIKDITQTEIDDKKKAKEQEVKDAEDAAAKQIALQKKIQQATFETLRAILDQITKNQEERVEKAEDAISKQETAVENQRSRAEQGLENTLAFEERQRAKAELELQKQQKRLEQAEKARALFASYTANANNPELSKIPGAALAKTLSDFAILQAIAASFGEGGSVEDVLSSMPTDGRGIIRGRSHKGKQGGIPVLVEGKEGFFSGREMANLGKSNFYRIKEMAGLGPIDTNFFTGQKNEFVAGIPIKQRTDERVIDELREVKKAIKSKPSQFIDMPEVVNGILRFTETVESRNMVKRNHYKIKKPRL